MLIVYERDGAGPTLRPTDRRCDRRRWPKATYLSTVRSSRSFGRSAHQPSDDNRVTDDVTGRAAARPARATNGRANKTPSYGTIDGRNRADGAIVRASKNLAKPPNTLKPAKTHQHYAQPTKTHENPPKSTKSTESHQNTPNHTKTHQSQPISYMEKRRCSTKTKFLRNPKTLLVVVACCHWLRIPHHPPAAAVLPMRSGPSGLPSLYQKASRPRARRTRIPVALVGLTSR